LDHGKIVRISERFVDAEAHLADEKALALHDQWHRRQLTIGAVAADHEIDLVAIHQAFVDALNK
jgi:hypothetical protein